MPQSRVVSNEFDVAETMRQRQEIENAHTEYLRHRFDVARDVASEAIT
jgi:hypothetical protein